MGWIKKRIWIYVILAVLLVSLVHATTYKVVEQVHDITYHKVVLEAENRELTIVNEKPGIEILTDKIYSPTLSYDDTTLTWDVSKTDTYNLVLGENDVAIAPSEKKLITYEWYTTIKEFSDGSFGSDGSWEVNPISFWNSSWLYRIPINITNNDGENYVELPLNVTNWDDNGLVFFHNGSANITSCKDVRVVCNEAGQNISHSYGISNCTATHVWLTWKLNLTRGETKICHVYYGNVDATAVNTTFEYARTNILNRYDNATATNEDIHGVTRTEIGGDAGTVTQTSGQLQVIDASLQQEVVSFYNLSNSPTAHYVMRYIGEVTDETAEWVGSPGTQSAVDGVGWENTAGTGNGIFASRFYKGSDTRGRAVWGGHFTTTSSTSVYSAYDYLMPYYFEYEAVYRNNTFTLTAYNTSYTVQVYTATTPVPTGDTKYTNHTAICDFISRDQGTATCCVDIVFDNFSFWKVPRFDSSITYTFGGEEEYSAPVNVSYPYIVSHNITPAAPTNATSLLNCTTLATDDYYINLTFTYYWLHNGNNSDTYNTSVDSFNNTLTSTDKPVNETLAVNDTWSCFVLVSNANYDGNLTNTSVNISRSPPTSTLVEGEFTMINITTQEGVLLLGLVFFIWIGLVVMGSVLNLPIFSIGGYIVGIFFGFYLGTLHIYLTVMLVIINVLGLFLHFTR